MDQREDFEVLDTEEYRSSKDQEFSHQVLVMIATKKVLEYGCQELIAGYYSTEEDLKGKKKIVYKQDTRKALIESIKTLRMVMICDFDETATKKLIASKKDEEKPDENLMDKLNKQKQFWLNEQKRWWESCTVGQQQMLVKNEKGVIEGYFNTTLQYYQQYLLEELEIYREIFEELTLLTKRMDFYAAEHFGA